MSIIVVSYNTKEITLACLRSVFEQTEGLSFEVIVIDNASSDGSAEAIEVEFGEKIQLIKSEKNLGFAEGNNVAIRRAIGEYLLLLNPDTIVLDNAVWELFNFAQHQPEARIWGGRTLFPDRTLNPASCWSKLTIWSLFCQASGLSSLFRQSMFFNPEGIGGWKRNGVRHVDIVVGCFLLITRDFWNQLKGFDPDFFMYGEESDLCLRAAKLGAFPSFTSQATIIHYGGASETVQEDKLVRLLKAKSLLIQRHFRPSSRRLGLRLLSLWPASRMIAHRIAVTAGKSSSVERSGTWSKVWNRRKEWSRL